MTKTMEIMYPTFDPNVPGDQGGDMISFFVVMTFHHTFGKLCPGCFPMDRLCPLKGDIGICEALLYGDIMIGLYRATRGVQGFMRVV